MDVFATLRRPDEGGQPLLPGLDQVPPDQLPWVLAAAVTAWLLMHGAMAVIWRAALLRTHPALRVVPSWVPWLVFIPLVDLLLIWYLAPFAIPLSLRRQRLALGQADDDDAGASLGMLWASGITAAILLRGAGLIAIFALLAMMLSLRRTAHLTAELPPLGSHRPRMDELG